MQPAAAGMIGASRVAGQRPHQGDERFPILGAARSTDTSRPGTSGPGTSGPGGAAVCRGRLRCPDVAPRGQLTCVSGPRGGVLRR